MQIYWFSDLYYDPANADVRSAIDPENKAHLTPALARLFKLVLDDARLGKRELDYDGWRKKLAATNTTIGKDHRNRPLRNETVGKELEEELESTFYDRNESLHKRMSEIRGQLDKVQRGASEWFKHEINVTVRLLEFAPWDRAARDTPYVGAAPFAFDDAPYFFGRDEDSRKLVEEISKFQIVVLSAPSGAGKSSLLNTRLRILLEEQHRVLPVCTVGVLSEETDSGQNPLVAAALASMNGPAETKSARTWRDFLDVQCSRKESTVLIIDQTEEILTLEPRFTDEKRDFFVQLGDALNRHPELKLLLSIREDYLGELMRKYSGYFRQPWRPFTLNLLTRESAKKAIEIPARIQGVDFDPTVLESLVEYLSSKENNPEELGFVEPLQLQLVCRELWKPGEGQHFIGPHDIYGNDKQPLTPGGFAKEVILGHVKKYTKEAADKHHYPFDLIILGLHGFVTSGNTPKMIQQDTEGYVGTLPRCIIEELEGTSSRLVRRRYETRGGAGFWELAHSTLIAPLSDLLDRGIEKRLRQMWLNAICRACDPESQNDVLRACFALAGPGGAPQSVLEKEFGSDLGELKYKLKVLLLCAHLLRRRVRDGVVFLEVSDPKLAVALDQLRADDEQHVRPFTIFLCRLSATAVTTAVTVFFTVSSRALIAKLFHTLTDYHRDGLMVGAFQGLVGGSVWGLVMGWVLSREAIVPGPPREMVRLKWRGNLGWRSSLTGMVGDVVRCCLLGVVGGIGVTTAVLLGQGADTIARIGWIPTPESALRAALNETHTAYAEPAFGAVLGLATGWVVLRLIEKENWNEFQSKIRRPQDKWQFFIRFVSVIWYAFRQAGLPLSILVGLCGFLLYQCLSSLEGAPSRLFGESLSIVLGGIAVVGGFFFGLLVLRWAGSIDPRPFKPDPRKELV
jgi:hypothetical protein